MIFLSYRDEFENLKRATRPTVNDFLFIVLGLFVAIPHPSQRMPSMIAFGVIGAAAVLYGLWRVFSRRTKVKWFQTELPGRFLQQVNDEYGTSFTIDGMKNVLAPTPSRETPVPYIIRHVLHGENSSTTTYFAPVFTTGGSDEWRFSITGANQMRLLHRTSPTDGFVEVKPITTPGAETNPSDTPLGGKE